MASVTLSHDDMKRIQFHQTQFFYTKIYKTTTPNSARDQCIRHCNSILHKHILASGMESTKIQELHDSNEEERFVTFFSNNIVEQV